MQAKEIMAKDTSFDKQIERIGTVVEQLGAAADPNTRALARELLESVMALHGAGLERILALARETGEPGEELIRKCGRDEKVSSLLLLYGLHPEDFATRVNRALEKASSYLVSQAARAELVSIGEDGAITVRLHRKPNGGCGSARPPVKETLEAAIRDAAPDAASIVVEEMGAEMAGAGFVSVAQLLGGPPAEARPGVRVEREAS